MVSRFSLYSIFLTLRNILLSIHTLLVLLPRLLLHRIRPSSRLPPRHIYILHPAPLTLGGGERVLALLLPTLHSMYPTLPITLICLSSPSPSALLSTLRAHFSLPESLLDVPLRIRTLSSCSLLHPASLPHFSLLFHVLHSLRIGLHMLSMLRSDALLIDTANLAPALVFPRLKGIITAAYVHYPTISPQMIREKNGGMVRRLGKDVYHQVVKLMYGWVGGFVDVAVANSSWTSDGLRNVWGKSVCIVFPPCGGKGEKVEKEEGLVVSVGQFRKEKRHDIQVDIMEKLKQRGVKARLVMIGGTRGEEDRKRVQHLKKRVKDNQVDVDIRSDVDRAEVKHWLQKAKVGIHTMKDEHFGIAVVEMIQSGVCVVGHRSGGVEKDIIRTEGKDGYLASSVEEFADKIERALQADMRDDGTDRFGDEVFTNEMERTLREGVRKAMQIVK